MKIIDKSLYYQTSLDWLKYNLDITELRLTMCGLTDEKTKSLSDLTYLKKLHIANNEINNISHLRTLNNLEYLDISKTNIESLPSLPLLKRLEFSNSNLTKVPCLKNSPHLEVLNLSNNDIVNLKGIKDNIYLSFIDLSGNTKLSEQALKDLPNVIQECIIYLPLHLKNITIPNYKIEYYVI